MSGVEAPALDQDQAERILKAIAASLRVVLTSPRRLDPGRPLTASLVPAAPQIDATELVDGVLNVAWTAKDVKFPNPSAVAVPDSGDLDGDSLAGTAGATVPGPVTGNQVTGALGQVFGAVGVPNLKVRVEITWIVRDQAGNELSEENQQFIAQQGLGSPTVSILLPPAFQHELRLDTLDKPPTDVYCLLAKVTLTIGSTSHEAMVGPVPVAVLPILLPTIVAMFSEPNFGVTAGGQLTDPDISFDGSAVLIMVPEHSPLASAEGVVKLLRKIEKVVDGLSSIGGFAKFLLGLGFLIDAIPEQPRIRFVSADEISRLSSVKLKKRPWYNFFGSDPNFDDKVESLVVFGPPGTVVEFFNDVEFKHEPSSSQGRFTIKLNADPLKGPLDLFVAIRTLDTDDDDPPVTLPPKKAEDFEPDAQGDGRWHTDLSSVRFGEGWLKEVKGQKPAADPVFKCKDPPPVIDPVPVGKPKPRRRRARS